jgi:pimeloyl-ACP methyl ester carboxylesterase
MASATFPDRAQYPFTSRYLDVGTGRLHYVDEGEGSPVVMVHGTPDWSFLYRKLIRKLSPHHRCIAADNLGFGLSDKPRDWTYRVADHARNFATFVERLGVDRLTLVVHDFGGPIGLSYAIEHPERIDRLVISNTFLWSLRDDASVRRIARIMGGPIGRFLYLRLNFSPRFIIPASWGKYAPLTSLVHHQYVDAAPRPQDRLGMWTYARELLDASDWYAGLWERRDCIKDLPTLLLWGLRDPAFGPRFLRPFEELFTHARVVRYPDVGHFVPDEAGDEVAEEIERFLATPEAAAQSTSAEV